MDYSGYRPHSARPQSRINPITVSRFCRLFQGFLLTGVSWQFAENHVLFSTTPCAHVL